MRPLLLALALSCSSCSALTLAHVARGAAWLGDALDAAQAGAEVYHRRHPHLEHERAIAVALRRARLALAALSGAVAAGSSDDAHRARVEALAAYAALAQLLSDAGVIAGTAVGGAETDAPDPGALELPSVAQIAAALE